MLSLLRVTDFILFGRVDIEFGDHLNVISGETGAGKSILLGAVEMLLGGDVSGGMIRTGADRAVVEGLFYLDCDLRGELVGEGLLEDDPGEELIVRRELNAATGRSRCFVNGALANLPLLRSLAERLIQVHGQQEHQLLARGTHQLELLDSFAGLAASRHEFASRLARYRKIDRQAEQIRRKLEQGERERELSRFQLEEIEQAGISAEQEAGHEEELKVLENAEKIIEELSRLLAALEGDPSAAGSSLIGELGAQRKGLEELAGMMSRAGPLLEQYDSARFALDEVTAGLRELEQRVEQNPSRLEEIRARLDEYYRLKKKYGPEVADVLATADRLREELAGAERGESELESLETERARLRDNLRELAGKLSDERRRSARGLEREVTARLGGLGMAGGRFEAGFQPVTEDGDTGDYLTTGNDRVTFLLSTNPGVPLMPLAEVASGGELSRIMLAIKSTLAEVEEPSTMIFDEVDAGIGGKVGGMVGAYLAEIARRSQVLVITHLASIAALADTHLVVEKAAEGERTETRVRILNNGDRPGEIARMLGGDSGSATSLAHAVQILESAGKGIGTSR
ncbi:MAG: DNA repair protein RecN [Candidatus Glassbacteria bacterium]|nr:DNA repair protein RecN [Candidatus Glassbacteria bacterium]